MALSSFEIIVKIEGVDYYLDTDGSTSIPLTLQVSDIREFATRRSSYSLSITVPETAHNRFIFNSVSDLSVDLTYFNPNWKSPCTILVDSIPVFTGNLQLKSVDSELSSNLVRYNCVVYSENDDFFKTVGEYTLGGVTSNLDFSEFNHKYNYDSIALSWTQSYESGYYYPLIDTSGIIDKSYIDGSISLPVMLSSGTVDVETYMLTGQSSTNPSGLKMVNDSVFIAGALSTTTVTGVTSSNALLQTFSTDTIWPEVSSIPAGVVTCVYDTQKSSGLDTYHTFFEFYKLDQNNTPILLGTSPNTTSTAVNTGVQQTSSITLSEKVQILNTDRLAIKIYAAMDSPGTTASFNLYADSTTDTRLTFPASMTSRMLVDNFLPATYIKTIWNKIFEAADYKYESNFLNTEYFNNLVMPFSQKVLENEPTYLKTLSFYVGKTTDQVLNAIPSTKITFSATPPPHIYLNQYHQGGYYQLQALSFDDVNTPYDNDSGLWDVATSKFTSSSDVIQQEFKLKLDISFKDWGTIAKNALLASSGPTTTFYRDLIVVVVRSMNPDGSAVSGWSQTPTIQQLISYPRIPFAGGKNYQSIYYNQPDVSTSIPAGTYQVSILGNDGTGNDNKIAHAEIFTDRLDGRATIPAPAGDIYGECYYGTLRAGEEVRAFFVNYAALGVVLGPIYGSITFFDPSAATPNQLSWRDLSIKVGSSFENLVTTSVIVGQTFSYNSVLPQNLKQKDFLTSIVKMFNLYIEPLKDSERTLLIEPRDDYYAAGEFKNWTHKIDATKKAHIQVLAETQNKSTLFTYKPDSDFYNTDFSNVFKREYGDVRYVIDNDFLSGEKKIDVVFSPTPLSKLNGSVGMVYPSVFKVNNGKPQSADGYNFRILSKNPDGLIPLDAADTWYFEGNAQTSYPYVGHFYPDPYEPTMDLNWGQSYLYYSNTPTNNNLFSTYWRNTINEISDINSRIVTLDIYLDSTDINKFRFNDNIYMVIDGVGGYYKVNKISNFDPTIIKPVTVEFIKSIDITVPILQGLDSPDTESVVIAATNVTNSLKGHISISEWGNKITGHGHIVTGIFNTVGSNGTWVNGDGNVSTSHKSLLLGDGNIDNSYRNSLLLGNNNTSALGQFKMLIGDNNYDNSSSGLIIGNNNFIDISTINIRVFGDFNSINSPGDGISIFGRYNEISDNGLVNNNSFIIGDSNIVNGNTFIFGSDMSPSQNTFNVQAPIVNTPNIISAGRDEVLDPFSDIVINIISAGRDEVRNLGSNTAINLVSGGYDDIL
jgi:hypothetical protein